MSQSASALKILGHIAFLAVTVGVLMAVILFALPDGNDYAKATIDKHERLDSVASPKLVFVGGSNLAYGMDSESVEHALGRRVVNMGMNAYLGVSFLLAEVEPSLKPNDVVVLSLENEFFRTQGEFDPVDGRADDLLMIVKTRTKSASYLSWDMLSKVSARIPETVQRKSLRILVDGARSVVGRGPNLMDRIEARSGFNAYGDLTSHIGIQWPEPLAPGTNLVACPVDSRVPTLIREFTERLAKRQVRVLMVPSPVPDTYYAAQKEAIDAVDQAIKQSAPEVWIAGPSRYVFPESCFFDDVHHLTGECRATRTARVVQDLLSKLEPVTARAQGSVSVAD